MQQLLLDVLLRALGAELRRLLHGLGEVLDAALPASLLSDVLLQQPAKLLQRLATRQNRVWVTAYPAKSARSLFIRQFLQESRIIAAGGKKQQISPGGGLQTIHGSDSIGSKLRSFEVKGYFFQSMTTFRRKSAY